MQSHGSKIHCPSCGTAHVVRVGEVKTHREIEFVCSACGIPISIASELVQALDGSKPPKSTKVQLRSVE